METALWNEAIALLSGSLTYSSGFHLKYLFNSTGYEKNLGNRALPALVQQSEGDALSFCAQSGVHKDAVSQV